MEKFYIDALECVKGMVDSKYGGNFSAACRKWDIPSVSTLTQWFEHGKPKMGNNGTKSAGLRTVGRIFDREGIEFCSAQSVTSDYDFVRKTSAKAGAGSSLDTDDKTVGYYAFRKEYLEKIGIVKGKCVLMDVMGDSMLPTLRDGDSILVDMNDTSIKDGKIYVVTVGDELLVKRVFRTPKGFILKSDNSNFPPLDVEGSDIGTGFILRGRVCWFGGSL